MREIKFRAWDKENKKMKFVTDIVLVVQEGITDIWLNDEDDEDISYLPCEVVLMQYTELKDTKGQEIYDGDILSWGEGEVISYVKWVQNLGGWFTYGEFFNERLAKELNLGQAEIIGNIYENIDLLK